MGKESKHVCCKTGRPSPSPFPSTNATATHAMAKFTKIFTFFDSAADLFRQIAYLPQKDFYELIEADRWTKLYFDIERC